MCETKAVSSYLEVIVNLTSTRAIFSQAFVGLFDQHIQHTGHHSNHLSVQIMTRMSNIRFFWMTKLSPIENAMNLQQTLNVVN